MKSADGKNYLTDVADTEQLLRLVQSIKALGWQGHQSIELARARLNRNGAQ